MIMLKKISLFVISLMLAGAVSAQSGGTLNGMTREQFREYKEAYLKSELKLSEEVSRKFFPVYEEYQDKKQANYKKNQELMNRAGMASEAEYRELIDELQKLAIESDKLENAFFEKAKTILTYEQLFKLGKAETNFQKHILRELTRKGNSGNKH